MNKFEIGDRVRWKGNTPTIGIIIGTDENNSDCYKLDVNGNRNSHNSCYYANLELISSQETIYNIFN